MNDSAAPLDQALSSTSSWGTEATPSELTLGEQHAKQPVATLVLTISFGALFFFLLLHHYLPGGISEAEERLLFVLGGAGAPLFGLAMTRLFTLVRRRFLSRSVFFPAAMALAHTSFWAVSLPLLRRFQPKATNLELLRRIKVHVVVFVVLCVLVAVACGLEQRLRLSASARQLARRVADDLLFLVPPMAAIAVATFCDYHLTRLGAVVALVAMGLPAVASKRYVGVVPGRRASRLIDASVVALIALLVFDAGYQMDAHHYGFYFDPAASLLTGRRPLVDINCQYGVGVLYFLAAVFKLRLVPATYQGLSALLSALGVIHFIAIYVLLRCCIPSRVYCLLGLAVILALRLFGGTTTYVGFPSLGALRFLGGYLALVFAALRYRMKSRERTWRALEIAVLAIASIWSVESFVGVAVVFLSVIFCESCSMVGSTRARFVHGARWLGVAVLAMATAHLLLALEIRVHAHEWPHWRRYFQYLKFYSTFTKWVLPINPWDPWAPIALVYGASIAAVLVRLFGSYERKPSPVYGVVLGAACLGLVEFSYYIGRSHIEALHVFMPHLFLGAFWLQRVARESSPFLAPFRASFLTCAHAGAGLLLLSTFPGFAGRFRQCALGYIAVDQTILSPWTLAPNAPWRGGALENQQAEAVALVRKYEPDKARIGLFMEAAIAHQTLLELGKGHVWPIGHPSEDEIEPHAKARILAVVPDLQAGDVIFVGTNLAPLLDELLTGLKARFGFANVETSPSGVQAIRLVAL